MAFRSTRVQVGYYFNALSSVIYHDNLPLMMIVDYWLEFVSGSITRLDSLMVRIVVKDCLNMSRVQLSITELMQ